jgi:hypothetical protein
MVTVPEYTLPIDRADTRPIILALKTGVNATTPLDQSGSDFDLVILNAKGEVLLNKTVAGGVGDLVFNLTLSERAIIPAGTTARYEIRRRIGTNQEPIMRGNINAKGFV